MYVSLRDGNGDEENMAARPECWQTNEKITGIGTEALKTHLQKKMVGWILRFIWESLDFLKLWCRPNEKGQFTADIKQGTWEINNKLAILSCFVGKLAGTERLKNIAELRDTMREMPDPDEAGAWVYARINMNTGDMYIGETTNFQQRFEQHLLQSYKHSKFCMNKCRHCKGHATYTKHQVVHYSRWIMIALVCVFSIQWKRGGR